MEFINKYKEKKQSAREETIHEQAVDYIRLADFDNKIFIAYNEAPLIPIEDTWTPKQILTKLEETRNSYISYRMQQMQHPRVAVLL